MSGQPERPWCDQIAWNIVFERPAPLSDYVRVLRAAGVTDDEIKEVTRFLGLRVTEDRRIGHPIDLAENVTRFPDRKRVS